VWAPPKLIGPAARAVPSHVLFDDIMAVIDDQQLSLAARRVRLERLARDRLTANYQGGAGASSAVLLLNLALLLSNAVQAGERRMPIEDAIVASLGCSLASATAILQILARQSVVRGARATSIAIWAESTLERTGTALSHVAAVVTILQSLYGAWSTWNEWGYSHPNSLASAVLGVGSGALLYFGWVVAFPLASGVGIALAIASAAVALVGDEDPLTKTTFIHFVNELKTSRGIRRFVDFLVDHPDGQGQGSNLQLDLRDIAERAQRTRIPKAVWDAIPALQRLGFDLGEAQRFTEPRPTYEVGPAANPERIETAFTIPDTGP
jgi:hypothetical protein